jgi:hypothetical protein
MVLVRWAITKCAGRRTWRVQDSHLALAQRQAGPPLADVGRQARRNVSSTSSISSARGGADFVFAGARAADAQVVEHPPREQKVFLGDTCQLLAQRRTGNAAYIASVDQHRSASS